MAKVLIVGKGARENALAHAYLKSHSVEEVLVVPGNAGSNLVSTYVGKKSVQLPKVTTIPEIIYYVKEHDIDLVDIGPESYLRERIVDRFHEIGLHNILGPEKNATILETDKCWQNDFWQRYDIAKPEHKNFENPNDAKDYVKQFYSDYPRENLVVKASGICRGQGSLVCNGAQEALNAVDKIMVKREFDNLEEGVIAGDKVCIQKRLYGQEIAFFVISDGNAIKFLGTALSPKRRFDYGDERINRYFGGINPHTGGMIAISPAPHENEFRDEIMSKLMIPTIKKFQEETSTKYLGIGYGQIILSEEDDEIVPRFTEWNVRGGDPEESSTSPRIKTDRYEIAMAALERRLHEVNIEFEPFHTYAVVAVNGTFIKERGNWWNPKDKIYPGYPGEHMTNQPIKGLKNVDKENCLTYHSGTTWRQWDPKNPSSIDPSKEDEDGNLETTGGRVLELAAKGDSLEEAKIRAYKEMSKIFFRGIDYRNTYIEPEGLRKL